VHPSAQTLGEEQGRRGLGGGSVVGARAQLGRHVIVNRGCLVGHHTEVGDYASIMAGANVAGSCPIGEKTYVGIGAVVLPARVVKEGVEGL
jgi:UDP-3-O-[3-hydroxymyristoyl] glucosamine N-acyltransferase